jgi:serine/threonine-protein kinase
MTRKGPLLTLLGGGALAAGLLIASINAATGGDDPGRALGGDGATPTATASPEPSPLPTPEPEEEPEPVTYVGWADGNVASVAIVVNGDEALAYVCDGVAVEAWLSGPAAGGELSLSGENGSLTAGHDGARATGRTTVGGREFSFTIEAVAAPEGLYRFADTVAGGADVVGGWIVLPDGTQVGILTVDGSPAPAPVLDVGTGRAEIEGTRVTVERQGQGARR